jgi:DnaJ-class molecular chaperone
MKDYYKILEINQSSSDKDIKNSYRRLVKLYHPDTNKTDGADEKIKEINEAYSILSDKEKKSEYDHLINPNNRRGNSWKTWESRTDSFEEFVKRNSKASSYWGFNNEQRKSKDIWEDIVEDHYNYNQKYETLPSNIKIKLPINVNDTLFGKIKTLTYKRKIVCECVKDRIQDCRICNDTGIIQTEFTTKIQVPKNVYKGSEILYKNFGNEGYNPNKFGDLHIVISDISSSPDFTIDVDGNIIENVDINIEDVLKETSIKLKSVLGEYEQTLKPFDVLKNNLKLSIENIGIVKNSMGYRTSHIVNFKITEPTKEFLEYIKNYKTETSDLTEETNE